MKIISIALAIYLIILNIIGFTVMGIDKHKARTNQWRIKEKMLFMIAGFGGSAGSLLGMYCFHHKTRHMKFLFGMPILLLIHIAAIYYYIMSLL